MKKWFLCPDKEKIEIGRCLDACRMKTRCLSPSTLALIADDREFTGVSPSMAGKGDRLIYLENVHYYAIDPRDKMFMTYGTMHHNAKEVYAGAYGEYKLDGGGTIDGYEEQYETLYDSKFVGSGRLDRIAKKGWLETGELYQKNYKDKKKGDPKVKQILTGWDIADEHDWVYQLNFYRIKMEAMGHKVKKIFVEATLRDGGTGISIGRGYSELVYMIPIQIISDSIILDYYYHKDKRVTKALTEGIAPSICSEEERWNDEMRCKYYCDLFVECAREGGWKYGTLKKVVKGRKK